MFHWSNDITVVKDISALVRVDPSCAKGKMFAAKKIITMAPDALAPHVASTSAAMLSAV